MNAIGNTLHNGLERIRVALEPITRRWLGSPLDDRAATAARSSAPSTTNC